MKKLISLFLALALLSAIAPFAAAEEAPTKLTYGTVIQISDYTGYEVFQDLCKEMNIELEYVRYDADSLSLMLSDGSLPDIMSCRLEFLDSVLKSGYALNFEPYIDEYLPNMRNPLYAGTNNLLQLLYPSEDNGIYIFCPSVGISDYQGGTGQYRGYIVRWDYYKELGCPPIESEDDYVDVLTKMVEMHPTDGNGNTMWAYGVGKSLSSMGGYHSSFTKENAVNLWSTSYLYKNNILDNHLVNGFTDTEHSAYWADMRFQNKLFRKGIYNSDVFLMDDDEFDALKCEGRFMGVQYVENTLWQNESEKDPETLAAYVVVPSNDAWLYADCNLMLGNAPAYYTFINKESPNKELAMQFMNRLYDPDFVRTWCCGKQGESWDYVDGVPTMKQEYMDKIANRDEDWVINKGYTQCGSLLAGYMPSDIHPDGYPIDLTTSRENRIALQSYWQKDFAAYYGEEYWVDVTYKHMQGNSYDAGETISAALTDVPMDIKRNLELCKNTMKNAMPELIMAESEEEFAEVQARVLQELADEGEAECWEWFNTTWEAAREIVMPIFEESCIAQGLR